VVVLPFAAEVVMKPLDNIRVLSLAGNLPGPAAVNRLRELGAAVVKVEPPSGDALAQASPAFYRALHQEQEILRLNLKDPTDRAMFDLRLDQADLFVTATRPAALQRLGLSWQEIHARFPRLCQVAIVGYPAPHDDLPGHDLNYQARMGLLAPPHMPRTCLADLAGAQEAVAAALALILARERGQGCQYTQVSLASAAEWFAGPLRYGLTVPGGILGGRLPGYNLYRAREGWLTVAALEAHFWRTLGEVLGLASPSQEQLQNVFLSRTAEEWEQWGVEHDLPIAALCEAPPR
jgi:crotonobetainyl-CoA:carnitine CoA-transferase CaiB-like acyl-CoA transferase